jgi:SAM-dependent methyltransferase
MTVITEYANEKLLFEESKKFGGFFNTWRLKRVRKLENIFGQGWFEGKSVLELGCAYGNIGLYLKSLGASVTFADARQEALDVVRQKDGSAEVVILNQEKQWSLNKKYDLILHFGLLYNLDNWKTDLYCTLHAGRYVALETAVARFADFFECKLVHPKYPHKLYGPYGGVGTLVSSRNIEWWLDKYRTDYYRYDDADLNINTEWDDFCYDWEEDCRMPRLNGKAPVVNSWDCSYLGGRRFWVIRNRLL